MHDCSTGIWLEPFFKIGQPTAINASLPIIMYEHFAAVTEQFR